MADVRISTEVDTSGIAAGMAAIQNQVQKTGEGIVSHFTSLFGAGVIIAEVEKVVSKFDDIHKQAARFSIDAEEFQKVANAAKELGIESETVARVMNIMEINAQKALDPTTKQAKAMEDLGISAKEFAAASPWDKQLLMADAYQRAGDKGQFYAEVSDIVGKKNTEMVALWAQGAAKMEEFASKFPVLSKAQVDAMHEIKASQDQYLANLDSFVAKAIVSWGHLFDYIKTGVANAASFVSGNGTPYGVAFKQQQYIQGGAASLALKPNVAGIGTSPGVGVSTGGAGGGGAVGSGTDWKSMLDTRLAALKIDQKINELLTERQFLEAALNAPEEQGEEHAASQYEIKQKINDVNKLLLPLQQAISLEEQKGVDAADRSIQKSEEQMMVDAMRFEAQRTGNVALSQQADLLETAYKFDNEITAAIDKANEARAKGLEQTAKENELLAQQLETEKQQALAEQQRLNDLKNRAQVEAQINNAAGALAANNLRLGATTDTYVQALAYSRGIQPGTPEYERLFKQVQAQDTLRMLTGNNQVQAGRDALVQWFASIQQGKATQQANASRQEQIDYFTAVAAGLPPPQGNFFSAFYGGSGNLATPNLSISQLLLNGNTTNNLLQQILAKLTPTPGGI